MLCWSQVSQSSDTYSGFFRYEKGVRVVYEKDKTEGAFQEDTITKSAVLHILIPKDENKAQISLAYGQGAQGRQDTTWNGLVIHRSPDMIAILSSFGADCDKLENYVIYPKQGVGFSIIYSAYMGADVILRQPNFPFGSANIIQLKKLEQ